MLEQNQADVKKNIRNLLENLGYIKNNELLKDLVKLSYDPPSYRIMADITLKSIEKNNIGISPQEAWRLTTVFVNGMKSNLMANNVYFQKILEAGLQTSLNDQDSTDWKLLNNHKANLNTYEYVNNVNIYTNHSSLFFDFVLFVSGFPLIIVKIVEDNREETFENEFIKIEKNFDEFPMFFNFNKLILLTDGKFWKLGSIHEFPEEYTIFSSFTPVDNSAESDLIYDFDLLEKILDTQNIISFIRDHKRVSEMLQVMPKAFSEAETKKDKEENTEAIKAEVEGSEDNYDDFSLEDLFSDEDFQQELSEVTYSGADDYGENIEMIAKYQADRSNRAIFDDIVMRNQGLVQKIANKYLPYVSQTSLTYDDLVSSGNLGMFRAIEKFDPSKGYQLSTYATSWINQRISRNISDEGRMIRVPVHQVEAISKLTRLENQMMIKEEIIDDDKILAELAIEPSKLRELRIDRERFNVVASTDVLIGDGEDSTLGQLVPSENMLYSGYQIHLENPAIRVEDAIFKEELIDFLTERLTERELDIVIRRNGLYDDRSETLEEIGITYGLTRERIRQIETKAYRKLKVPLEEFIKLN